MTNSPFPLKSDPLHWISYSLSQEAGNALVTPLRLHVFMGAGELNEDGVDLAVSVILEYSGGRRAVLTANSKLRLDNRATVYGTKGRVTV
ncbi:Trans-1,2-dihydrobenzene-1,2-diol dehydrogenase [Eumeta japonica]|uniref:Trans-1,2-dihydrobenzene-1,2-diol dehydrogenase n=1 Tax=Eumeta variegata TaxID=151549 RepID=A0A4C1ZBL6_EUMVA|nr:Trans-1,2-dihydrobenzene-1,2-diol dehydrogenase [Eumeta japonica]